VQLAPIAVVVGSRAAHKAADEVACRSTSSPPRSWPSRGHRSSRQFSKACRRR
jgi:hypothetical protein